LRADIVASSLPEIPGLWSPGPQPHRLGRARHRACPLRGLGRSDGLARRNSRHGRNPAPGLAAADLPADLRSHDRARLARWNEGHRPTGA